MDTKACSKCKVVKPFTELNKQADRTHGIRSACMVCTRQTNKSSRAIWRAKNPDRVREQNKNFRTENPDYSKTWYADNLVRERGKRRMYQKAHPEQGAANTARYRASKIQRTPAWSETLMIQGVYENCPEGYHVDHVVPLQGKTVSGLHVFDNLQYLTAEENIRKSNTFEGHHGTEEN